MIEKLKFVTDYDHETEIWSVFWDNLEGSDGAAENESLSKAIEDAVKGWLTGGRSFIYELCDRLDLKS
mgnify:FL=1